MKQIEDVGAGINGLSQGDQPRSSSDPRLARAMEEYQALLAAGEKPNHKEFLARYPELAGILADCLDGLDFLHAAAPNLSASAVDGTAAAGLDAGVALGDFRIVREVGRGGMGVVYEAEQLSLRRRVALKVLPFAATMDARHLQRFHNEAQAAACLHHTNIVPVFSVGCERGVHFYAMQFIDGQPLSEIIRQLRRTEKPDSAAESEQTAAYQPLPDGAIATAPTVRPAAEATPLTREGRHGRDYYRKVAEIGVQTAEALDHAHQLGIVHRDIKPANLMLDGTGRLWVTDFGLAHVQHSEASLTMTGQALGTPRYMSPEQALAKRVPIDHRTDVYSLGVTLYELLTLRSAFASEDRHELLRQIAFEEPVKLRRLDRAIPAELETIILKAMEKRPQDRYATAQELADDLRNWLHDRPIQARRPSWVQVGRKWVRRHQAAARAAALLLVVFVAFGFGFSLWWVRQQAAAETEARAAFDEAVRWQQDEKWSEALSAARRAQGALHGFGSDASLRQLIDERAKDLEMAQLLEEARLQHTEVKDGHFDSEACIAAYREAFAFYGLDVEHGDAGAAAECIQSRSISMQLVAALDNWANLQRLRKDQGWTRLLAVARVADRDELRNRLRDAWEHGGGKTMYDLVSSADAEKLLTPTLRLLLYADDSLENAPSEFVALLRRVQQQHPADFWINHDLAMLLYKKVQPPQFEEAVGYYRAAVALRPQSPGVHLNLGNALYDTGRHDEAIDEFRKAILLNKDFFTAYPSLANALRRKGLLDEAIAVCREAIRIKKDYPTAHANLGDALLDKGRLDEAIAEHREAIRIKKDYSGAHTSLGIALAHKGQLDDAIGEYREAIRLDKNNAYAHYSLGVDLAHKGQLDDAISEYREAIRIRKDFPQAHTNLGSALLDKGRLDEAIVECREAIRTRQYFPEAYKAHAILGRALSGKGQLDDATAEWREVVRLKKDDAAFRDYLRQAEQMSRLDGTLPRILEGKVQPKDAAERLAYAWLCQQNYKKRYAIAARFYSEAFAEQPRLADDLNAEHRYNAACAAALAGCGQGDDADKLDTKERARLRQQALDWLRADLKTYRQMMDKSTDKAGPMIAQLMQHWLQDGDFAGVRGDKALAKLPEDERSAWRKLWADVAEMLAKVQGKAPPEKKPDTK